MIFRSDERAKWRIIVSVLLIIIAVIISVFFLAEENGYSADIPKTGDRIIVLDVGQGDSILIASNGEYMLVDTGEERESESLSSKLRDYGVETLNVAFLTHFHTDHAGGIEEVTEEFVVENLVYPDISIADNIPESVIKAKENVLKKDGTVAFARKGMTVKIGNFNIEVIGYYPDFADENDCSIVLMVEKNGNKFLLTSDISSTTERAMIEDGVELECDILKVAHHGGSNSTSAEFLKMADPEFAIISCGLDNPYAHPNTQTLNRLRKEQTEIYRTDLNGDVCVEFSGKTFKIHCESAKKY